MVFEALNIEMGPAGTRRSEVKRVQGHQPADVAEPTAFDAGRDGVFEGYASLFEREDLGHDVVVPGAFERSLQRRGARGVKMLFQHDPNQPIGVWLELKEDRRGLYVRGRLLSEIDRGREVLALMRAGVLDGLSIGFKTVRAKQDRLRGTRRLEAVDLWEISIVTFPMLEAARVGTVKRHGRAAATAGRLLQPPKRQGRGGIETGGRGAVRLPRGSMFA